MTNDQLDRAAIFSANGPGLLPLESSGPLGGIAHSAACWREWERSAGGPGIGSRVGIVAALALGLGLLGSLRAGEGAPENAQGLQAVLEGIPYDFANPDGLYSTTVMKKTLPKVKFPKETKIKLSKEETGFQKEFKCLAYWQSQPAPLVVVFVGLGAECKSDLSRTWQYYAYQSGCHVLAFDSVFRPDLGKVTRHGVAGNIEAEAQVSARIIELVLQQPGVRERVTGLRLLGTSYGGVVALAFNRLAQEGKLQLKPERVLVLSPPISLRSTTARLDRWYSEDFRSVDIFELTPLQEAQPLGPGEGVWIAPKLMRAGIAYVFHEDLQKAVKESDKIYDLNLLKRFKEDSDPERRKLESGEKWTFSQYVELMAFPYWQKKAGLKDTEELWQMGDLQVLLAGNPANVRVVLAADDPLNEPAELAELGKRFSAPLLTVLPCGGHLGYVGTQWVRKYIETYLR